MMKGFVQGADRQQTTLLPECLDDWVDESNPVRAVDVFVDTLELRTSGSMASPHTRYCCSIPVSWSARRSTRPAVLRG
jgi:hypothetical protein